MKQKFPKLCLKLIFTYRGYAAQDLCEYCKFEEVAYLILNKDLPNTIEFRKFEKEERNNRDLSKDLYSF